VHGEQSPSLCDPAAALCALATYDEPLATSWRSLLESPWLVEKMEGVTFADFDETADEAPVTAASIGCAVLLGCMHRLLGMRRRSFEALRRGFLRCEDLQLQLAAVGSIDDLALLLQGKQTLSSAELLDCFILPHSSDAEEAAAGFADVGSRVPEYFEELLSDGLLFDERLRLHLLRYVTALVSLPVGGLQESKVRLRLYGPEPDDFTLPECHTCTRELHLPNYTCLDVLRQKLLLALEHSEDGFQKQ